MKAMRKRLLSGLLTLTMLLTLAPTVFAADEEDSGGLIGVSYNATSTDKTQKITTDVKSEITVNVNGTNYPMSNDVRESFSANETLVIPAPNQTVVYQKEDGVIAYTWTLSGVKYYFSDENEDEESEPVTTNLAEDGSFPTVAVQYPQDNTVYTHLWVTYQWTPTKTKTGKVTYDFNLPSDAVLMKVSAGPYMTQTNTTSCEVEAVVGSAIGNIPAISEFAGTVEDFIACKTAKDENDDTVRTWYEFLGWKLSDAESTGDEETSGAQPGGEAEEPTEETDEPLVVGEDGMSLVAQWREIPASVFEDAKTDPKAPELGLTKKYTVGGDQYDALISQHSTSTTWGQNGEDEPLELDSSDRLVYYRATMEMDSLIAALLEIGGNISDPTFAGFTINVDLDDKLEWVTDPNGLVNYKFTCTFLEPTGKVLDAEGKEIGCSTMVKGNTTYFTVVADDLPAEFSIPVQWKPGAYHAGKPKQEGTLQEEIVLEVAAAKVSGEGEKTVITKGDISGYIDLDKAGRSESEIIMYILSQPDWVKYYSDDSGKIDIVNALKAEEHLKYAIKNLKLDANEVYAHVDGPEQPTGTLTVTKYVADNEAVEGQEYTFRATIGEQEETFTLKDGETKTFTDLALNTVYSITEIDSKGYNTTYYNEEGTITEDGAAAVVINVPADEGALVISKTVNGGDLDKEFSFKVELSAGGTYSYTGSRAGTITSGEAVILKNGESISINNLPEGTAYTVTEAAADDYTTTVSGHDAEEPYYGNTASGTIVAGAASVAHYTNTYDPAVPEVPGLTITKELGRVNGKSYTSGSVEVGDTLTYTITVRNTGNTVLNGITVTDELPAGLRLVSSDLAPVDTLAVGASETFTVEAAVRSSAAGTRLTNTATAKCGEITATDEETVKVYEDDGDPYVPPVCPTTPTTPAEPEKPTLNLEDHVAYIIGYVDGTVRPLNNISRSEVATIFFRLLTDESRAYFWSQTNPYSDVDAGDWFNNAISTLSNAGIITGYPDGTFRPEAPITRSEFAAIAARFSEVIWNGGNSFSDVPENHWAARYIALAEHLGWITGYPDGTFKPDQNITRAESMTLINRVLERAVEEEHMLPNMVTWVDNVPGTWSYEAVQEATNSHEYVRLTEPVPGQDFCYEDWQEIGEVPDWAALERTWSTANIKY